MYKRQGFYHPTGERQSTLNYSYNFLCQCERCLGLDSTRGFFCKSNTCVNGIVFPVGNGEDGNWRCSICGNIPDLMTRVKISEREAAIVSNPPKTIAEIQAIISEGVLHPSHYLLFWAINDLSMSLAAHGRATGSLAAYSDSLQLLREAVRLLEQMVNGVHHEKVVFYDRLAQLAIATGDIASAQDYFRQAYEMSRRVCGSDTPSSRKLLELATQCPSTIEELVARYGVNAGGTEEDEEEGEEWEDVEEDDEPPEPAA